MMNFIDKNTKTEFKIVLFSFLMVLTLSFSLNLYAQSDDFELELLHVQGNVYLVAGGGGNTGLQVGEQGVVVVDTKHSAASDQLVALIEENFDVPIHWIVNTHAHSDHTGGNAEIAAVGSPIGLSPSARNSLDDPALIYSHIGTVIQMLNADGEVNLAALPKENFTSGTMEFYANGESVQLIYQPAAHTSGDSLVFFRGSNVLVAGDIFTVGRYPFIDVGNGGTVSGLIDALNNMLLIVIPDINQQGGTYIIPGHGRITDEYELVNYRDMVTIIYERVAAAVERGLSLEETKAERLSRDYDPLYGSDSGFWTTEKFIETIYTELIQ